MNVNRQHKDRLFRFIFSDETNKKYLLSLYNALNDTDYTDVDSLDITTIRDVIYMGMKNDSAFIIDSEMNLFEQQSTYNPNMPFREFQYCARMLDAWVTKNELDIYSSTLVEIPAPRCYVFYNGENKHEDTEILRLSDAFMKPSDGYEWTVIMLNINKGHNKALLEKCQALSEYTDFVTLVRENRKRMCINEAVDSVVRTFIAEKRLLADFLRTHRAEVIAMCITEYNEELHISNEKQISYAKGHEEGHEQACIEIARSLLGLLSDEVIAEKIGLPLAEVQKLHHA